MNRALPLLVVLVLVAAAATWFLQDPVASAEDPVLGPAVEEQDEVASSRLAPELDEADGESAEVADPVPERSSVPAATEDAPGPDPAVLPWPAGGVELELVRADGRPAAGALVHYLPGGEGELRSMTYELLQGRGKLGIPRLVQADCYRADEAGRVRVPEPGQEALVRASLEEERGYELLGGLIEPDGRIDLAVPRTLTVRVEDSLGLAQGGIEVTCDGPWSQLVWGTLDTHDGGEAQIHNANTLLAPCYGEKAPLLELAATTWDARHVTESVDLRSVPAAPVLLVLPAGGEVQVQLVTPDGTPLTDGSRQVALDVEHGTGSRRLEDWVYGDNLGTFRGLPPGARVTARLGNLADVEELAKSTGVVPPAGAEPLLLLVTVEPPPDRRILGRLVDTAGAPLARATYSFRTEMRMGGGSSSSTGGSRQADAEGRIEEQFGSHFRGLGKSETILRLTFTIERGEGPDWISEPLVFEGDIELPLDLGDVVCAAPRLLAAGRLVDPTGDPIQGGRVEASYLPPDAADPADGGRLWGLRMLDGQSSQATGADGAFAVHADTTESRLFLRATAEGYGDSDPIPFNAGAANLVVTLGQAGSLMGSVRVPRGTEAGAWSAGIQPAAEEDRSSFSPNTITGGWSSDGTWWDSDLERSANFGWRDLEPGLYNVRIKLRGVTEPVRQWDDLVVEPGEVNRDPRLQEVELDGLVTSVPIEVVDPGGEPIPGAQVRAEGGEGWNPWTDLPGGSGSLTLASLPQDLVVQAPGYLTRVVATDGAPVRVVLDPAPRITLTLPAGLALPEGTQLQVHLQPVDQDTGSRFGGWGDGDTTFVDGSLTAHAPAVGPVNVVLILSTPSAFGSSSSWLAWPDGEYQLDLSSASDGATYELPVTPEMVQEAGP